MIKRLLFAVLCMAFAVTSAFAGVEKLWTVESESKDYRLTWHGDTADIIAPKGLTMWYNKKMSGRVVIEYDACVVVNGTGEPYDRLSDLNCFWMASVPSQGDMVSPLRTLKDRNGVFLNCYTMQLYYLGYGGNHNSTTRFRRYDGDAAGVTDASRRPKVLKEYTDAEHLLKANHWYHIRITNENHHITYEIDGQRIVDFRDPNPLTSGWFGFRTTLSHTRLCNFRYTEQPWQPAEVKMQTVRGDGGPVSWGVPFDEGQVKTGTQLSFVADGRTVPADQWPLAYWPDGSIKWMGLSATVPQGAKEMTVNIQKKTQKQVAHPGISIKNTATTITVKTDSIEAVIPRQGQYLVETLTHNGVIAGRNMRLVCSTQSTLASEDAQRVDYTNYVSQIDSVTIERQGRVSAVIRIDGKHQDMLPFRVRLYFHMGSKDIRMVHTFIYDRKDEMLTADGRVETPTFLRSLGVRMDVPLRDELYNRYVAFSTDNGVWKESVKPLDARYEIAEQALQAEGKRIDEIKPTERNRRVNIDELASWDSYRLSQLTANGYTIRKRAKTHRPWIGTIDGRRNPGYAYAGDIHGGMSVRVEDFWQSYPSSIEIDGMCGEAATMTMWLWSPDAEPMDLRHYDDVAHGLLSSYEDVQAGMSTPYGIARTSSMTFSIGEGRADVERMIITPTPQYLHDREAFGVWSLPDSSNPKRKLVEDRLESFIEHYKTQVDKHSWYGFWNYGDFMHTFDYERGEWRYDVGGFAWDNTELAPNMFLWYSFLRTGRADVWRMAEAMTRHAGEVDVYHIGPNAMLGSRHNVSHWGCGAKEARISQAAWNRFYYYLTTDERCGDLMRDVVDSDQKLYELDPMRLAQPRNQYPCTAPARLRIGPDWLAYAGNWMTEWERTGNVKYRDKILAGMKSICQLPSRMFTGPLALGYDPATGIITSECDPKLQTTNHLMTIMGGFEVMNEMIRMISDAKAPIAPEWKDAWLEHARHYKRKAMEIRHNAFRISRLLGYAAYNMYDADVAREAWEELINARAWAINARGLGIFASTNDVATWALDAIYMQEVIPE